MACFRLLHDDDDDDDVGARLGAFFYWTRFLENNVPFDNIPL